MESELFHLGIEYKHSRPYHPQTCGKVERFHQTLKKFLAKQPPADTIAELQAQVDRFVDYTTTSVRIGPRIERPPTARSIPAPSRLAGLPHLSRLQSPSFV